MSERKQWLEELKIVVTVLVLLGHVTYYWIDSEYGGCYYLADILGTEKSVGYKLFNQVMTGIIYSFHMPLFMAISGMCFNFSVYRTNSLKELVKSKSFRLLLPFLAVNMFYSVPIRCFTDFYGMSSNVFRDIFLGQFLSMGTSHLWYLSSLFWIFVIFYLIVKTGVRRGILFYVFLYLLSCNSGYITNCLGLAPAVRHLFYFGLGFELFHFLDGFRVTDLNRMKKSLLILGFPTMMLAYLLCSRMGVLNFRCAGMTPVALILALWGSWNTIVFSKWLSVNWKGNRLWNLMKKNTYELYLYSDPLNYIVIYLAFLLLGEQVMTDSLWAVAVIIFRFLFTLFGSLAIIQLVDSLKLKTFFRK